MIRVPARRSLALQSAYICPTCLFRSFSLSSRAASQNILPVPQIDRTNVDDVYKSLDRVDKENFQLAWAGRKSSASKVQDGKASQVQKQGGEQAVQEQVNNSNGDAIEGDEVTLQGLSKEPSKLSDRQKLRLKRLADRASRITKRAERANALVQSSSSVEDASSENLPSESLSPIRGEVPIRGKSKLPDQRSKGDAKNHRQSAEQSGKRRRNQKPAPQVVKIRPSQLKLTGIDVEQPPVRTLSYGLDRVLFNPGVYNLQDSRSRVYNFDPYLQTIMPIEEFDFGALKGFVTSSKDTTLAELARKLEKRYVGSTSSMTAVLSQFHYLLSSWREINTSMLSKGFPEKLLTFTQLTRGPAAFFLKYQDGIYALDGDKEYDRASVLSSLGQSLEKLLTLPTSDYERYRKSHPDGVPQEMKEAPEAYHYSTLANFLMRSQLDAYDSRLPGSGMFDLKTRAVVAVRMDAENYEKMKGYEIKGRFGQWESYEKEYHDMIRSVFLKYSLQVRIGNMDGIFVAFHNTERIFGFQYISLPEMDLAIHGQANLALGDQEFKLSVQIFSEILDKATARFPGQSIRFYFETREATRAFMYIFAEPVTESDIEEIQTRNAAQMESFQRNAMGLQDPAVEKDIGQWEDIQSQVQKTMDEDEFGTQQPRFDSSTGEAQNNFSHGLLDSRDVHEVDSNAQMAPRRSTKRRYGLRNRRHATTLTTMSNSRGIKPRGLRSTVELPKRANSRHRLLRYLSKSPARITHVESSEAQIRSKEETSTLANAVEEDSTLTHQGLNTAEPGTFDSVTIKSMDPSIQDRIGFAAKDQGSSTDQQETTYTRSNLIIPRKPKSRAEAKYKRLKQQHRRAYQSWRKNSEGTNETFDDATWRTQQSRLESKIAEVLQETGVENKLLSQSDRYLKLDNLITDIKAHFWDRFRIFTNLIGVHKLLRARAKRQISNAWLTGDTSIDDCLKGQGLRYIPSDDFPRQWPASIRTIQTLRSPPKRLIRRIQTRGGHKLKSKGSAPAEHTTRSKERQKSPAIKYEPTVSGDQKPLLAMTLTIRNQLNGLYVVRPWDLHYQESHEPVSAPSISVSTSSEGESNASGTQSDKPNPRTNKTWAVEYMLEEIDLPSRARRLYNMCKQRRRALLGAEERETSDRSKRYIDRLRNMSQQGREWRQERDEMDKKAGLERVVLGQN